MNFGILLGLITILTMILILSLNKFTYNICRKYAFNIFFGILFLAYFLIFRYVPDLIYYIENIDTLTPGSLLYSFKTSKVFLMDMCPLMAFLLPLSMIIDKSRSIAKVLSPIALLGGMVTIFGGITFEDINKILDENNIDLWEYIFIGTNSSNRIYFSMHYLMIIFSLLNIINSKKYTRYSLYGTSFFYVLWMIYMQITINVLNVTANATGLVQFDWFGGEYTGVTEIIYLSFPFCVIFWYTWAIVFNFVVCLIRNKTCKNKIWFWCDNEFWYSNNASLSKILFPIDRKITSLMTNKFSWIYK